MSNSTVTIPRFAELFLAEHLETWWRLIDEKGRTGEHDMCSVLPFAKDPVPEGIRENLKLMTDMMNAYAAQTAIYGSIAAMELLIKFVLSEENKLHLELGALRKQNARLKRLLLESHLGKLRPYDTDRDLLPESRESSLPLDEGLDEQSDG